MFLLSAGTESETKAFMAVCIETAKRYSLDDYRTPVFIFERLCSIIYPVSIREILGHFYRAVSSILLGRWGLHHIAVINVLLCCFPLSGRE